MMRFGIHSNAMIAVPELRALVFWVSENRVTIGYNTDGAQWNWIQDMTAHKKRCQISEITGLDMSCNWGIHVIIGISRDMNWVRFHWLGPLEISLFHITAISNDRHGVSNYRPIECLFNTFFRLTTKNIICPRLCPYVKGIHKWPVDSLQKGTVKKKMVPFDDIIMMSRRFTSRKRH